MKNLKREILLWMDASVDVQTHKYNGKELDLMHGLNEYDYGARQLDPAIGQFTSMDPLCEKYYHISPYAYCGGNPVNRVDPDGRYVVADSLSQINITNTLSDEEKQYVHFDSNGLLNKELLNLCDVNSANFDALLTLANSDICYNFISSASGDEEGLLTSENGGVWGVTCFPLSSVSPSKDDNVNIYTASFASEEKRAINCAHEAYGHAFFYEISRTNFFCDPYHRYGIGLGYDSDNTPYFYRRPTNTILENRISIVTKEALYNYGKKNINR